VVTGDVPPVATEGDPAVIDDLAISGFGAPIDGPGGVLGRAGPRALRPGTFLPITGSMVFDSADIPTLINDGRFVSVVLHEMAHVLGIGTLWDDLGLYRGGANYLGPKANKEWNALGCPGPTPVEQDFGPGSAGSHWDEVCLANELMTPRAGGAGDLFPLSRITVGSLDDIGYGVNYNCAESYTPPRTCCPNQVGADSGTSTTDDPTEDGHTNNLPPPLLPENLALAIEYGRAELEAMKEQVSGTESNSSWIFVNSLTVLFLQDDIIYDVFVSLEDDS
jgi:Leishmanolysin